MREQQMGQGDEGRAGASGSPVCSRDGEGTSNRKTQRGRHTLRNPVSPVRTFRSPPPDFEAPTWWPFAFLFLKCVQVFCQFFCRIALSFFSQTPYILNGGLPCLLGTCGANVCSRSRASLTFPVTLSLTFHYGKFKCTKEENGPRVPGTYLLPSPGPAPTG